MAEAPEEVTVMRIRSSVGARVPVTCPLCLVDYEELMRAIDHGDQMMGYSRRSVMWWNRGSSHILEVCLFNSYVLDQHGKEGDMKRDYLSFSTDR